MTIEIELNHLIDKSVPVAIVLLCFFVGMRVLYGYWPWQSGPKPRKRRQEQESGPHDFLPLSGVEREGMSEPNTNGVPVAATFMQPMNASAETELVAR